MTSPERLDYCISKAGLSAFTQGLALRLAQSEIAVFEVRPGIIRTEMTAGVADKYDALIKGGLVPMRRWGEAGDVRLDMRITSAGQLRVRYGLCHRSRRWPRDLAPLRDQFWPEITTKSSSVLDLLVVCWLID